MSSVPTLLPVYSSTKVIFASNGVGIAWDTRGVRFLVAESTRKDHHSPPQVAQEFKFENEEILDVAVHDDDLFILTGIPTGDQWRRQLRRGQRWDEDQWTNDHPLYSYDLRLFSVHQCSQMGVTLQLPDQGVKASIHAGTNKVIVQLIGPNCYASVWRTPTAGIQHWQCVHEELTWDPDIIAKKLGFRNHQEEIAHIKATGDAAAPNGDRERFKDVEFLDYAFITDTLVLRIRDVGVADYSDREWVAEVIDVSSMEGVDGRTEAPTVVHSLLRHSYVTGGIIEAFIHTPTKFSEDDWISITLTSDEGVFQMFYRVNELVHHRNTNPHVTRESNDPFTDYAFWDLGPTFSGRLALHPAVDVDPTSDLPVPSLRFLRFATQGNGLDCIDIPVMRLFDGDPALVLASLQAAKHHLPPYVVAWDGRDTVCIICRDSKQAEPPALFFVQLGHDTLERLAGDSSA
ncbi:hypothetical protein DFH06DRAFT_1195069 [Mycena polygramma]|nr:hypothetical protein DFH06DRAFT_1195069 [Mycena polygramma]